MVPIDLTNDQNTMRGVMRSYSYALKIKAYIKGST